MTALSEIWTLPGGYWLALIILLALVAEATTRWRERWVAPAMMVYATVFAWYMLEPVDSTDMVDQFSSDDIGTAFLVVAIFLLAFRFLCTLLTNMMTPKTVQKLALDTMPTERIFIYSVILWLLLLAIGVARLDGDVILALFPVDARNGNSMWLRAAGADAGPFGFAVSLAGYFYTVVLAAFGMLLPLLKRRSMQVACVIVILIAWPYIFLQGSRNVTLAVFVPMVFSFLFFSRVNIMVKGIGLAIAGVFIEAAMRLIITYRNVGFDVSQQVEDKGHLGLNMASELVYSIGFIRNGILQETWGMGLLSELANIIPRPLWPNKPLLGIDYAIARGYSGGDNDLGVVATISTGMIGQGVLEFGFILGPIVSAALLALWCAFLARLWAQGTLLRACLFLLGIGLTFNLGRNITMLVLWPMLLAYASVVVVEFFGRRTKKAKAAKARAVATYVGGGVALD